MPTRTLFYGENKQLHKKDVAVDELGPHDVLIKTKAIAFNPTDYKHLDYQVSEGSALGTDSAGEIVGVGANVSTVKVGDTVAALVGGGNPNKPLDGAFATLATTSEFGVIKFPHQLQDDTKEYIPSGLPTTFEQAASLPVGLFTAVLAFVGYNDTPVVKDSKKGYALVYGAASSLGFQVTQLAVYLGYDVIAVASKKHADLLKSIGVQHLVDYHDSDWTEQVSKIGGDDITYAYDTISQRSTVPQVLEVLSDSKPSKLNLSTTGSDKHGKKSNVEIDVPLTYFLGVSSKKFGPTTIEAPAKVIERRAAVYKTAVELVAKNLVKTLPIHVVGEGIDSVPKGIDTLRNGVSGEKVVVRL